MVKLWSKRRRQHLEPLGRFKEKAAGLLAYYSGFIVMGGICRKDY
jgi:hypothetical protein